MSSIAGVILAGGRGERLGGAHKALIEIGGVRLIDRAAAALAGCTPLLVASGARPIAGLELTQVPDLDADYAGPVAGVAAAMERVASVPTGQFVVMAVDTPFWPDDFVSRALQLDAPAVVASYDGQIYPTNALWRTEVLAGLPKRVREGSAPHSLKRLLADVGAVPLDYAGRVPFDPFASINTPEELAMARWRATAPDFPKSVLGKGNQTR